MRTAPPSAHAPCPAALLAALLAVAAPCLAQTRWRHVADFTDTRAMVAVDGMLVSAASRGGAVYDPAADAWDHVSLPQGMLAIDLVDVCDDGEGMLFWAGADASLSARGLHDGAWSRGFLEFREHPQIHEIHDLWGAGGTVLVSHTTGLTRFDYLAGDDEFLVRWNLHTLGDFPQMSPVLAAAALGSRLVAVTSDGIAQGTGWPAAPLDFTTQVDPGGLATIATARLAVGGARLFALLGSPQGEGWLGSLAEDGQWRTELADLGEPLALAADGDRWAVALASGSGSNLRLDGDTSLFLQQRVGGLAWIGDTLWCALVPDGNRGGWLPVVDGVAGEARRPDLPGAEDFVDLDFAPDGSLWAAGVAADRRRNGLYRLRPEQGWQDWKLGTALLGNYPTSVACDRWGGVWFGTWGQGCGRLLPDSTSTAPLELPPLMSFTWSTGPAHRMVGFSNAQIGEGAHFPLVSDVNEDAEGNLWIVNHQALDDSCLVVVPAAWYADTSTAFARHAFAQLGLRFPWSILHTRELGTWAGVAGKDSRDEAKRLIHVRPPSGQQGQQGQTTIGFETRHMDEFELADAAWNFGLPAPGTISALGADPGGNLWVATSDGFYMGGLYGGVAQFSRVQFISGLVSEQLSALTLDGRGRVWLGAAPGLSVYEPERALYRDPAEVDELNSLLSRLEDFQLNAVAVDPGSGALWVAGNLGLFTCATGARDYGPAPAGNAVMYPNPFRPDGQGRARLLPQGLANDAAVTLYDANGRRVRHLDLLEAEEGWDGRDEAGRLVDSGVYLILVTSGGGSAQGKVAVIR